MPCIRPCFNFSLSMNLSVANWPPLPPSLHQRGIHMRPKTYKGIFLPHFGRSQYIIGDYYSEFGKLVRRSFSAVSAEQFQYLHYLARV